MARVVLVLILGAMGSIPLVILTPPFQVPDEVQHFYRAYQISELRIRAEVQGGVAGGTLPNSLRQLVESSVYSPDGIRYPATPAPIARTLKLAKVPLNPSDRQFVGFPGSAFYSPLPYLPQAFGIAVGRAIGLGPLYLLYLGRFCNCLAALGLLGLAVWAMPAGEEFLAIAGLLPMALYLYASLSPDAAIIGCALFFSSLAFRASMRGEWKSWELWATAAAGAVFCSVKPVYAPLLLAGLAPGILQREKAGRVIRAHAIVLGVGLGAAAAWLLFAKSTMTTPLSGAHPATQISLVLHHPAMLARAIANTLGFEQDFILYLETVGVFGWMTVPLWPGAFFLPLVSCVVAWRFRAAGRGTRSTRLALWYLALAAMSGLLVILAMYLMFAHVAQADVPGAQGRYFIPLLGLVGMAAITLSPERQTAAHPWKGLTVTAGIILVQIIAMDATIVRGFRVF